MKIFRRSKEFKPYLDLRIGEGSLIGFVPTMGALHQGHISLIDNCNDACDLTVCSIFVNPTQFNDKKDFDNYPTTLENDIYLLEEAGCDVLFLPSAADIYPDLEAKPTNYNLGYIETVLEGKYRPGHFQGVCQVIDRFLFTVPCQKLFLGQKDYQQCMVIRKMLNLGNFSTETIICPTLRDANGLAMSSRNLRLSVDEKDTATTIFKTLSYIKSNMSPGDMGGLLKRAKEKLTGAGFTIDYVAIANADTLELLNNWDGKTKTVALIAATLNEVRLIDNMLLHSA